MPNDAYLASETLLFYGGPTFLADLTNFAGDLRLVGRTIDETVTVLGTTNTEVDVHRVGHTISPSVLYSSVETDKIRTNRSGVAAVVYRDTADFTAYPSLVGGIGRNADSERFVLRRVAFAQAGAFVDGAQRPGVTRAAAWNDGADLNGLSWEAGDVGYLIVTAGAGAFGKPGGGPVDAAGPGIYDMEALTGTAGSLSTPAGSSGWLLIGRPGEID